jgi:nucleoside-diphosphate-sugar epimerase
MRLLLIGGTGFIGPHVADSLEHLGHEVVTFHRGTSASPSRREILGDRRRLGEYRAVLQSLRPDVVIDLILSSGSQARELIEVFRGATSRLVALSSCDVYRACGVYHGSEPLPLEPLPLTESSALRSNLHIYSLEQVRALQRTFGWLDDEYEKIAVERELMNDRTVPATILRLPMVYGPRDPLHRIARVLGRMDDRRPAILFEERYAAWRSPRGFVRNVAAAIALAATDARATDRIYNVGDIECQSELEWAQLIADRAGWRGRFVCLPRARTPAHLRAAGNIDQHWVTDTTRIREELGYREVITTDEALDSTIAWERENRRGGQGPDLNYALEDQALDSENRE